MAVTQADIDAFDAQTAQLAAVEATTFQDRSVKFRTLNERAEERARLVARMNADTGKTRTRFAATSKGC